MGRQPNLLWNPVMKSPDIEKMATPSSLGERPLKTPWSK
jgi:hypothetical protein